MRDWLNALLYKLSPQELASFLESLDNDDSRFLIGDWPAQARPEQLPPDDPWRIWLFLGGRGAGKTRSGAQWIAEGVADGTMQRIGLIGATFNDARAVMIEGVSGLKAICDGATFEPSNYRIKFGNGAIATVLSADEPDGIRGHQFDTIWADEFCKWPDPQGALDMALMALRVGADPRMAITTTPRNIAALKDLLASPDVAVTRRAGVTLTRAHSCCAATSRHAPNPVVDVQPDVAGVGRGDHRSSRYVDSAKEIVAAIDVDLARIDATLRDRPQTQGRRIPVPAPSSRP